MKMKNVIPNPFPDEVAFRVNYQPEIRKYISVNGHYLSRPHFTSDLSLLFSYICSNPNRPITREEIEKSLNISLKKGLDDILRDLGFRGVLAKIFFKEMSNSRVHFTNPVTHRYIESLGVDIIDVYRLIFTPKRKSALYPTS